MWGGITHFWGGPTGQWVECDHYLWPVVQSHVSKYDASNGLTKGHKTSVACGTFNVLSKIILRYCERQSWSVNLQDAIDKHILHLPRASFARAYPHHERETGWVMAICWSSWSRLLQNQKYVASNDIHVSRCIFGVQSHTFISRADLGTRLVS